MLNTVQIHSTTLARPTHSDPGLAASARAFEAMIVSQMLQAAGLDKPPSTFGGGVGEEQFASFMTDTHAKGIAASGGIGLAERLIRAMADRSAP